MQKLIQFFKEVREEFQNITWPKKDALIQLTIVVISISIIISLILGGFDYLFVNTMALLGQPQVSAPIAVPTAVPDLEPLPSEASVSSELPSGTQNVNPSLQPSVNQ